MISGGRVIDVGHVGCGNTKTTQISTGDYNHDGAGDKVYRVSYSAGCKPDVYLHLRTKDEKLVQVNQLIYDGEGGPINHGFWQFSLPKNLGAASQPGKRPFQIDDKVQTPFGPNTDKKGSGRIAYLILEIDPKNPNWARTIAEVFTPYGTDFFDLSALTLISPAVELDIQVENLIHHFSKTKDFQRREAILQYADFHSLKPQFKDEVARIEGRLSLAFEKRVAKLDLDRRGKQILLDKMGEKLGFREYAPLIAVQASFAPAHIRHAPTD